MIQEESKRPATAPPDRIGFLTCSEVAAFANAALATLCRYQDLLAAVRATLAADRDGEPDPLYYVRDELQAQLADDIRRSR